MKKHWKLIMTLCVVTLVGLGMFEFNRQLKQEIIDIAGEKYFYEEEKVDAEYAGSYTFDGEEIKFYFDNYYGLRGSYLIKDGNKVNMYTDRNQWRSKDLSKILHVQVEFVDQYDVYMDGILVEPTIIENENVRVKIYEYHSDSKVIAVPTQTKVFNEYTVMQCKDNQAICKFEMNMDLEMLKEHIDSWERIKHINDTPHHSVTKGLFYIKSKFYNYEFLHNFVEEYYSFSAGKDENGQAYVGIGGNTNTSLGLYYRLTDKQYEEFIQFVDNCELTDVTKQ